MSQTESKPQFIVRRDSRDRRSTSYSAPPYFTEEGMVMVDRREGRDRRTSQRQTTTAMSQSRKTEALYSLEEA